MKLFYSTGTSSMSAVALVEELGIDCELIEVSWSKNKNVVELEKLNPLGTVATLLLDDGTVITQNIAILEYLADLKPEAKLLAPVGTSGRAIAIGWVSFVAAELHKSISYLFQAEEMTQNATAQNEIEDFIRNVHLRPYLQHIDQSLRGKDFICGSDFTIADCHIYTITGSAEWADIDLSEYKELSAYRKRIEARPAIQRVFAREG